MAYIKYFIVPFILSFCLTPVVRKIAIFLGFVSYPRADRWHKKPTALLGGIGIYLSVVTSIALLHKGSIGIKELGFFITASFLFLTGLLDDKFHIRPYTKLLAQIICAGIVILCGVSINWPANILIALPLTIIWIIGITNAFNLLDNIDGLCAGISGICGIMVFFSLIFFAPQESSQMSNFSIYALILAGAALGFLPYNFTSAKIFMGDSGSMFLGYSLAIISITGMGKHISSLFTTMLIPVLILSVPIFDTIFVIILRKLRGQRIFEGGKDHTSHRLITLGLSQPKTVLLLYAVSIIFGAIAVMNTKLDPLLILIIVFLAAALFFVFGFFLSESSKSKNQNIVREKLNNEKTIINGLLMHKRRIVEVLLDLGFICTAYYAAYFLRFEGELSPVNLNLIKDSLIWLIIIKMSIFFIFGLYRGVWRYVSISDILTISKTVTIGSMLTILFLTFIFRFSGYSRAVFFLDWLILLFLICAARISFRVLGEFFNRLSEKGENVLIFGAGDMGEIVIREIKRNKKLALNPVGFIDDDPVKIGNKIQGMPVFGSRRLIKEIIIRKKVKKLIIAVPDITEPAFSELVKICKDCGISFKKTRGIFATEETDVANQE